jgi:hypothetical protein
LGVEYYARLTCNKCGRLEYVLACIDPDEDDEPKFGFSKADLPSGWVADPEDPHDQVCCDRCTDFEPKCVMPRVGGSTTGFRCLDCGSNVFTEYKELRYKCNGCGSKYVGEK